MEGQAFYAQDTSLLLYRIRQIFKSQDPTTALDTSILSSPQTSKLLDPTGAYVLHAKIDIQDGNNQALREQATKQLFALRDTLKSEVTLAAPDRLAMDTKIQIPRRRP